MQETQAVSEFQKKQSYFLLAGVGQGPCGRGGTEGPLQEVAGEDVLGRDLW